VKAKGEAFRESFRGIVKGYMKDCSGTYGKTKKTLPLEGAVS
jgi:hypothetical protein